VSDDGIPPGCREAQVLLVWEPNVAFREGMKHIITPLLERIHHVEVHVFVKVDLDA
jgi:hypothetical protein